MSLNEIVQGFHFLRPWWLLLLPLLLFMLWHLRRLRLQSRRWQTVCDAALLPHLLISEHGVRQRRGPLLMVALVGLMTITALAGPAWKQLEQPVFRDQAALVLLLDLSRSMDATDVKPTRLTRARLKLIDILNQRKEGQSALIVYAADAFVVSPLTEDAATIVAQVSSLKTTLMPQQGSRPDLAIDMAQQLLIQAGAQHGELLLITDGLENVPTDKLESAVAALTEAGYRLSILGVGSAEGAPIALPDGGFLKDSSGAIVIPRLDDKALRDLAQQGAGHYQAMRVDDLDIATLLDEAWREREVSLEESQGFKADQWYEEGPWLLLLVMPLVLVLFRRGQLLVVCLILLPVIATVPRDAQATEAEHSSSWWSALWLTPDQRASQAFKNSDVAQAAALFENREWQAAAHYRNGDYQQAIDALAGIESADAYYNKGNAYAQLKQWQAAIGAYEQALRREPEHADAKYNLELVKRQLEQESGESGESGDSGESASDESQSDASDEEGEPSQSGESQQGDAQQQSRSGGSSGDPSDAMESQQSSPQGETGEPQAGSQQAASQNETVPPPSENGEALADNAQPSEDSKDDTQPSDERVSATASELSEAQAEIQSANDQWLRRIPDDPGGLLRRKFQYQSQRAKDRSGAQAPRGDESW